MEPVLLYMLSFIHEVTEPVPLRLENQPNMPLRLAEHSHVCVLRCVKLLTRFPQQSQILMCWVCASCGAAAFPKDTQTLFKAVFDTGWEIPALTFG